MSYRETTVEGRFLAGDREAVGTVMRWVAVVVASHQFWRLRPEWPDLHQEILGRVTESLRQGRFDESRDFRAYVLAVARYTMVRVLTMRRDAASATVLGEANRTTPPDPETAAESRLLARRVLEQASEGCRDLLTAYFYRQQDHAEIAESIGVPVGTVKSRLARCLDSAHRAIFGRGSGRRIGSER